MKPTSFSLMLWTSYELEQLMRKHPNCRKHIKQLTKEIEEELAYLIKYKKAMGDA